MQIEWVPLRTHWIVPSLTHAVLNIKRSFLEIKQYPTQAMFTGYVTLKEKGDLCFVISEKVGLAFILEPNIALSMP